MKISNLLSLRSVENIEGFEILWWLNSEIASVATKCMQKRVLAKLNLVYLNYFNILKHLTKTIKLLRTVAYYFSKDQTTI